MKLKELRFIHDRLIQARDAAVSVDAMVSDLTPVATARIDSINCGCVDISAHRRVDLVVHWRGLVATSSLASEAMAEADNAAKAVVRNEVQMEVLRRLNADTSEMQERVDHDFEIATMRCDEVMKLRTLAEELQCKLQLLLDAV